MNINLFIDKLFEFALENGIKEFEAFYAEGSSFSVKIFNGIVDDYKNSSSNGLSFRGIYNDRMGYSYTENFSEDSIELLVKELIDNATILENDDKEFIYEGAKEYKVIDFVENSLSKLETSKKIEAAIEMERLAKELDKRVNSVNHCLFGEGFGKRVIRNSKGLHLENSDDGAYAYINVVVKDGDETRTGFALKSFKNFEEFNPKKLAKEAVDRAISLLGSKSVKSGEYDVIIENEAFGDLLQTMSGIFSAEAVDKGLSRFKGKLGEVVANNKINLVDNPFMVEGVYKTFDDEGVPTEEKTIIENGILKTFLHNLKTANKNNLKSTGNGQKASYKSSVGIAPYNFYIKEGEVEFKELVRKMSDGLILIEFDGLHSGLNAVSGDFSLSTRGYRVENGEIVGAINEITLAANFFDLLLNVEEIGKDLKFGFPGGTRIGSPSMLFRKLSIAGE